MRIHSMLLGVIVAALPVTAFAQTLYEPQLLPPNVGDAPAIAPRPTPAPSEPRAAAPSAPQSAVRATAAQAPKQNVTPTAPQNTRLAAVLPRPTPQFQSPPPPVRPSPPPPARSFAPRQNYGNQPEIEVSERVTYAQEGELVRMKIVRDFKVNGQIVRSESAEVLGKPGRGDFGRSSGKRGQPKGGGFTPAPGSDQNQAKEYEGPLY